MGAIEQRPPAGDSTTHIGVRTTEEGTAAAIPDRKPRRIASLDAFRGAVIASMILVNNPGDADHVFAQLAHVPWNGWTFTDLIAPAFMWIIGVTTTLSLTRRLESAPSRMSVFGHVVRRSVLLFVVGLGLVAVLPALLPPNVESLQQAKLMDILQRIAVGYCLAAAICLWARPRAIVAWVVGLLVVYWYLLVAVPLPGGGAPSLQPDHNLPQVLDLRLLGVHAEPSHSLLTILSVTATILMGALASQLLRVDRMPARRALLMAAGGTLLIALGLILAHWMPINRRLWTPSFAVLTAGIPMVAFAAFYWVLDGTGFRRGFGPLMAYGANPILLFVLSEAVRTAGGMGLRDRSGTWHSLWAITYHAVTPQFAGPKMASFLFALGYTLAFGVLAILLYRRRWIVKL